MTAEPVPVPRDREQIAHDGAGMLQIAQRLEERHDTLRVRRAGRRLEKFHHASTSDGALAIVIMYAPRDSG